MLNIIQILSRFKVLLLLLLLQGISLYILFNFNSFHRAAYLSTAYEITGSINLRYNNLQSYFNLKAENDKLREQNVLLLNQLKADFQSPEKNSNIITDTISADKRKYLYLSSKVISSSVIAQNNFVTLYRGANQGVEIDMGVVGIEGVIGRVVDVSPNMSIVMSLIHRKSSIVAQVKTAGGFGEIVWDGKDPHFVTLIKIAKAIDVKKGDTVVTSPYSDIFPPGQTIGFISDVKTDENTNTYVLKVKTAINFYNIQHAFLVKSLLKGELDSLINKVKKD
jgi:rod shape-determining protein MreC